MSNLENDEIRIHMATLHNIHTQRLVSLAKRFQITRADEAAGHCLSLSLDFALVAKHLHDIDVDLVKWTVADDPAYVDHWAVVLHGDTVIDLTRVQVDGTTHLTAAMVDYPANFRTPRIYPASLLARAYADARTQDSARLSNRSKYLLQCSKYRLHWRNHPVNCIHGAAQQFAAWTTFPIQSNRSPPC